MSQNRSGRRPGVQGKKRGNKMNQRIQDQSGVAMATAVMVLAIVVVIVAGIVVVSVTQASTIQNNERAMLAFNYAESGIDYVLAKVRVDQAYPGSTTETTTIVPGVITGTGTLYVRVLNSGGSAPTITVTAWAVLPASGTQAPMAQRAIEAKIGTLTSGAGGGNLYSKRPITANGSIKINRESGSGKFEITYNGGEGPAILSNSPTPPSVVFSDGARLEGDPSPVVVGYVPGSGVAGIELPNVAVQSEPQLVEQMDWDYWSDKAQEGSTLPTSAWTTNWMTVQGPTFVNGDLLIKANHITLSGVFYVVGTVTISSNHIYGDFTLIANKIYISDAGGNGTVNVYGTSAFLSRGNFEINHNSSLDFVDPTKGTFIYADGDFLGYNKAILNLYGAIAVQGDIDWGVGAQVKMVWKDVLGTPGLPPPGFDDYKSSFDPIITAWREVQPPPEP
jgi:Tfp pilus assembly protein PilX